MWKGSKSPEEVQRLNQQTLKESGLANRGEENRKKLLEGIDSELIAITRRKSEIILQATNPVDRGQAEGMIDAIIKSRPPRVLIPLIHGASEEVRSVSPVTYAAMAFAFLALTNESSD